MSLKKLIARLKAIKSAKTLINGEQITIPADIPEDFKPTLQTLKSGYEGIWHDSSLMFNGTLVIGGLLVTAFAVYLSNDMSILVKQKVLRSAKSPRTISTMFIIMGIMLAGVGLFPVNVNMPIHNFCASGMALMFIAMLAGGPWMVSGMPRANFTAAAVFLIAVIGSTALFIVGYFGLTAFEIVVFALIFGWIAVFMRFLGVAGLPE